MMEGWRRGSGHVRRVRKFGIRVHWVFPWRVFYPALATVLIFFCMPCFSMGSAHADTSQFVHWVEDFWPAAKAAGISQDVYDYAFEDVAPDPQVVRLAMNQPEFTTSLSDYLQKMISEKRIMNGTLRLREHEVHLLKIERTYRVDRHVVLAIWGMESNYGEYMGDRYIVRSLATLASQGIREKFFRQQLISVLKILQSGDISRSELVGSWAGAIGHTQFIPTTFESFGVDMDGDGRRDLRGNFLDALASTAHYLARSGWAYGRPWGIPVILPSGFYYGHADDGMKPPEEWSRLGVRRMDGSRVPDSLGPGMLLLPVGARGSAFLVTENFRVIMRYNNARKYALAVGLLSDRLRGDELPPLVLKLEEEPLRREELRMLQSYLVQLGKDFGEVDGVIGPETRSAIREYQREIGLPEDGYESRSLLDHLRRAASQ